MLKVAKEADGDPVRTWNAMRPFEASHQAARSLDAALEAGIPANDVECVLDFKIAHQIGAQNAFRFAQIILSDPQLRGQEIEALKLLEQGCDHAEIRAALRSQPAVAGCDDGSSVVAFRRPSPSAAS